MIYTKELLTGIVRKALDVYKRQPVWRPEQKRRNEMSSRIYAAEDDDNTFGCIRPKIAHETSEQ